MSNAEQTKQRLEYLRGEIRAERISYGEIAELESLRHEIEPGDVELLEWAGVPEFKEDDNMSEHRGDFLVIAEALYRLEASYRICEAVADQLEELTAWNESTITRSEFVAAAYSAEFLADEA